MHATTPCGVNELKAITYGPAMWRYGGFSYDWKRRKECLKKSKCIKNNFLKS